LDQPYPGTSSLAHNTDPKQDLKKTKIMENKLFRHAFSGIAENNCTIRHPLL